jgi:hypothetical protein
MSARWPSTSKRRSPPACDPKAVGQLDHRRHRRPRERQPAQPYAELPFRPEQLAEMVQLIEAGVISGKIAKEILPELLAQGGSPKAIVDERGLGMISDPGGDHGDRGGAAGGPPRGGGGVPRRQDQAAGLLRGPADEEDWRQGRPQARQPDPQRQAQGLNICVSTSRTWARVSGASTPSR